MFYVTRDLGLRRNICYPYTYVSGDLMVICFHKAERGLTPCTQHLVSVVVIIYHLFHVAFSRYAACFVRQSSVNLHLLYDSYQFSHLKPTFSFLNACFLNVEDQALSYMCPLVFDLYRTSDPTRSLRLPMQ
jgi:hypothetical protein